MRIGIKRESYGNRLEWLDSEQKRHVTNGVVIDATKVSDAWKTTADMNGVVKKVVPDGMPLAKLASGKYAPLKYSKVKVGTGSVETCTLEDAKNFQVGDAVHIGTDAVTLTAVNPATGVISWTGAVTIAVDDLVTADDGGTGSVLLAEAANITDGDGIFGAIDMARVKAARLPVKLPTQAYAGFKMVVFN